MCFCKSTFFELVSHLGMDHPVPDLHWELKSLSCRVQFMAVHSKDIMVCRASGSTNSHIDGGSHFDLSDNCTDLQYPI